MIEVISTLPTFKKSSTECRDKKNDYWINFLEDWGLKLILIIGFLSGFVQTERVKASTFDRGDRITTANILLTQKKKTTERLEEQLVEGMDRGIKGDYQGAIAIFSRLIAQNPDYAEAYYNRGFAQGKLENYQAAIVDYSQAIKINSQLAEAYQERGLLWQKQAENQKAIADFKKAAALYKNQDNKLGYQTIQELLEKLIIK